MSGRVVLAGGTGFIGRHLVSGLREHDFEVVLLTRQIGRGVPWDGKTYGEWAEELEGAYAVINLAGESVSARWTAKYRKAVIDSRVDSTRAIGEAIARSENPPLYWINASAIGYYGSQDDRELTEGSPNGHDFLGRVCDLWEDALWKSFAPKTHKTVVRVGFVLGRDGGGFPVLKKLTRAFLGGAVGSGAQWTPWIHVDDLTRLFLWTMGEEAPAVVNGCAPNPVTNSDLMRALRHAIRRPWAPPAPAFVMRLIRQITQFPAPELLLNSQRALPLAALQAGFEFRYPDIEAAINELVSSIPDQQLAAL